MMNFSNRRLWIYAWIVALATAVIATAFLSVLSYQTQNVVSAKIARISAAAALLSTIKDAETGQRGYILTGVDAYLAPFNSATQNIPDQLATLRSLFNDNDTEKREIQEITDTTLERIRLLKVTLQIVRRDGLERAATAMRQGRGLSVMNALRAKLGAVIIAERNAELALLQRLAFWQLLFSIATVSLVIITGVAMVGALVITLRGVKSAEQRSAGQSAVLTDLLEATPDPIFVKDMMGVYTHANPATLAVMGRSAAVGLKDSDIFPPGAWEKIVQDDRRAMSSPGGITFEEDVPAGPGRQVRTFLTTKTPVRDAGGNVMALLGVSKDITDRKLAQEQQQLLLGELNHRVKNILTVVHSIAIQSFSEASLDSRKAFEGRLAALSSAQNALITRDWKNASLRVVVNAALAAHCGTSDEICRRQGPEVEISAEAALSVSMILHELSTNAVKYGALSAASGRIALVWDVEQREGRACLVMTWTESGGPPVTPPQRRGFGTRLIEHSLRGTQSARLRFEPGGLVCEMVLGDFAA